MRSHQQAVTRRIHSFALGVGFLVCAVLLLTVSDASKSGVSAGLTRCMRVLIPSLFPFMVLSSFCVKSGLSEKIGRLASPLTGWLFHLPGCCAATILMSLIGGFPVGAQGVRALLDSGSINHRQAGRMMFFCVGAGPAFVISAVGEGLLGNLTVGIVLYGGQVAAALLIGVITGQYAKHNEKIYTKNSAALSPADDSFSEALVSSVAGVTQALLQMCAFVVLFSAVLDVLDRVGLFLFIDRLAAELGFFEQTGSVFGQILCEVTAGVTKAAEQRSISLLSFALGWSGFSVHFQVYSILSGVSFSKIKFMAARLCHGILASLLAMGICKLLPQRLLAVINSIPAQLYGSFYASIPFCFSLLVMCAVFLFTLPNLVSKKS